jgi:asparagine synthase (glutamine-hydrolysing)
MCGIAGLWGQAPTDPDTIERMTDSMRARGPDDSGAWLGDGGTLAFGHRRLSVIDLSAAGHQPMASADGRYTLTYNGEIYNFGELRAELESEGKAPNWRGHSDTEVLLAAVTAWGPRNAIERAAGMFALALWDSESRQLTLARDRFGEKPLYFGWIRGGFAFGSTLAPIRSVPGFDNPVDPAALACLLARAYVPAPLSIYRRVFKLPPGSLLTIGAEGMAAPLDVLPPFGAAGPVRLERYFDYGLEVLEGTADPIADQSAALEAVEAALTGAVSRQLVADVPVGTFLSGGIDSSLITAIAQKCVSRPIRSFTIGFHEQGFNEAEFAKLVAQAIGTEHTELYVTDEDAREVIPQLPTIYDEPFADSSQIPTHLVSKLARQQVTVSLSGDAGDELFGGYNRHIQFPKLWRRMQRFPAPVRRVALEGVGLAPPSAWNMLADLSGRRRSNQFGRNARRALKLMARSSDFDTMFDRFLDQWAMRGNPVAGGVACGERLHLDPRLAALPLETRMMQADAVTYLPDDILCKVDRAAMAVSLESRVPFLDPQVTAVAARISPELKIRDGSGKHILTELLATMIPRESFERPKAGFAVPIGEWIRRPLRDWAESLLDPKALAEGGLLDPVPIRQRWQSHLAGREDASEALWSVLMFQAWHRGQ